MYFKKHSLSTILFYYSYIKDKIHQNRIFYYCVSIYKEKRKNYVPKIKIT